MKKILLLLIAAVAVVSCDLSDRTFKPSISLAVDNLEVNLPKSVADTSEPTYYCRVTSTGRWEASIETQTGDVWCWLQEYANDVNGERYEIATPLEAFEGMEEMGRWSKVEGKSGTTWLPVRFLTSSVTRYGALTLRNLDTGEVLVLRITQK